MRAHGQGASPPARARPPFLRLMMAMVLAVVFGGVGLVPAMALPELVTSAATSQTSSQTSAQAPAPVSMRTDAGTGPGVVSAASDPGHSSLAPVAMGSGLSGDGKFRLTKTANPTSLPYGGGTVTYTYTVENLSGGYLIFGSNTDDTCNGIQHVSGMESYFEIRGFRIRQRIPAGGVATFRCTVPVTENTTNTATFRFGNDVDLLGNLLNVSAASAQETVTVDGSAPDVCNFTNIWGIDSSGVAREFTTTGAATGRTVNLTSTYSHDIALSPDGRFMVGVSTSGNLRVVDLAGLLPTRTIAVSGYDTFEFAYPMTSLSFGAGGLLYVGGTHGYLYQVDIFTNPTATNAVASYVRPDRLQSGFAGDFITLANGDILALAAGSGGSRFVLYRLQANGTFAAPIDVGYPVAPSGARITVTGATYSQGSLFLGASDGYWYRLSTIPQGTVSTSYPTVLVSRPFTAFRGATGAQEANAICSSPDIDVSKTAGAVTGPNADGQYTVNYAIQVTNTGLGPGTYGPLTDSLAFDSELTPVAANWTGPSSGSAQHSGPYQITTNNTSIPANTTHTYQLAVNFTRPPTAIPTTCDGPGTGLYNSVSLPPGAEPNTANNAACANLLVPLLDVEKTARSITGPNAAGEYIATYTVTVRNVGTGPGTYGPLVDTPQFDPSIVVTGATWTGHSGGSASGPGPFTISGAGTTIAAKTVHTYTVAVAYTVIPGTFTLSECGANPVAGSALYNSVAVPAGQETSSVYSNNAACLTPPVPPFPNLDVTKSASTASITGSGPVTYTYVVTNTGNEALSLSLADDKCPNPTYQSGDTNNNGFLDLPESWRYTCTQTVSYPAHQPVLVNTVTATGTGVSSSKVATSTAEASVTVNPTPANIDIRKTAGTVTGPDADGIYSATYTLEVINSGQAAGTYGPITDSPGFDANLTVTGAQWSGPASGNTTGSGPFTIGSADTSLAGGTTHTYALTVFFRYTGSQEASECGATPGGGLLNTAAIPGDDTPADNSACLEPPPLPQPAVTLVKTVSTVTDVNGNSVTDAGDTIGYTFTIYNAGNTVLANPTITDSKLALANYACGTGPLNPGSTTSCTPTARYVITTADQQAGSVTNTGYAQAFAPGMSTPVRSPDASTTTPTATLANVNLAKTVTSVSPTIAPASGQFQVTYAITVTNSGETPAAFGPLIESPRFAPNLEIISAQWSGHSSGSAGARSDYTLAPSGAVIPGNSSISYQITFQVRYTDTSTSPSCAGSGTGLYNFATVSTEHGDFADNIACGEPPAPPAPQVELTKSTTGIITDVNNNQQADAGDTVAYTFTVRNTGNVTVTGIAVTDDALATQGATVTCTTSTLQPGQATNCTASRPYQLTQADVEAGSIVNTATVSANGPVGDPVTDTSTATVEIPSQPKLKLIKTATVNDVNATNRTDLGDTITYSFEVTNTGNRTLTGLQIADDLLAGAGITVSCPTAPLEPLQSVTCTASGPYTITSDDVVAMSRTNTAVASAVTSGGEQVSDDASADVPIWNPGIQVTKHREQWTDHNSNGRIDAGDRLTYRFEVTNTGNTTLTTITITDPKVGNATCTPTTLAPGESVTCYSNQSYLVTEADAAAGSIVNNATASGRPVDPSGAALGRPVTDIGQAVVVATNPAIALVKTHQPVVDNNGNGRTDAGDEVVYLFTVTNTGNTALTNLRITDPRLQDLVIECQATELAVDGSTTCQSAPYVITSADMSAANLTNTATVWGQPPFGQDVSASATVQVPLHRADLTFEKFHASVPDTNGDGRVSAGDVIRYEFRVTNTGLLDLSDVVVDDPRVGSVTCPATTLAAGTSMVCWVDYEITAADAVAGVITNTATVTAQPSVGTALSASDTDTQAVARAEITLTKIAGEPADENNNGRTDVGDTITYSFLVVNTGNVTVTGVSVSDEKLAGQSIAITCPQTTLQPGQSTTCTSSAPYVVTGADTAVHSVSNSATVTAQPPAGTPIQASDSVEIPAHTASMSLVKSVRTYEDVNGNGRVDAGDRVLYQFLVSNTGSTILITGQIYDNKVPQIACDTMSLGPNEQATCWAETWYVVTDADLELGAVNNTATASGQPSLDGTTSYGSRIQVTSQHSLPTMNAAIALAKTVTSVTDVNANGRNDTGDIINYALTVTNRGDVELTNLVLSDPGAAVTCPATTLAAGATMTCTGTHTVTAAEAGAASYTNTATITGTPPSGTPVSATATAIQPLSTASLELDKQVANVEDTNANGRTGWGDTITYEFHITNTGTTPLANIQVNDPKVGAVTCPDTSVLDPGQTRVCTASYVISRPDALSGTVLNTATVTAQPTDDSQVVSATDQATVDTVLAEMTLNKEVAQIDDVNGDGRVDAGDTITYEFTITNTGTLELDYFELTDDRVTGITCPSLYVEPGNSMTCTADPYLVTVADAEAGIVHNEASVSAQPITDNGLQVGDRISATDSTDTTLNNAKIELEKTISGVTDPDGDGRVSPGDVITYRIVVTNTGSLRVVDVEVTESLAGAVLDCPAVGSGLTAGQRLICTATYEVTDADAVTGTVTNSAAVTAQPVDGDGTPVGEPVYDSDQVSSQAMRTRLQLVKSVDLITDLNGNGRVDIGDQITYEFDVTNDSTVAISDVRVSDPLLGTVTCPVTVLAAGESTTCTAPPYVVTAADAVAGQVMNTASASAQPPSGNRLTASDSVTQAIQSAAVTLTKTAAVTDTNGNGRIGVDDTITYTFVVTNTGNVTVAEVTVTDPVLDADGNPTADPRVTVTCPATTLAPGESMTCQSSAYTITHDDAQAGQVVNTGFVAAAPINADGSAAGNPISADASATVTTVLAELAFTKRINGTIVDVNNSGRPDAGDSIHYAFDVTNVGNLAVNAIAVTDPAVGAVFCPQSSLLPGETMTCNTIDAYIVTHSDGEAGFVHNEVSVTGRPVQGEPLTETAELTLPLQQARITLVKTAVAEDTFANGRIGWSDEVTYSFTVTNNGNVSLNQIVVADPLLVDADGNSQVTCPQARLAPGESMTCTAPVHIITEEEGKSGRLTNTATVTAQPVGDDDAAIGQPVSHQASADILTYVAQLILDKSMTRIDDTNANGRTDAGDVIHYTITVANEGNLVLDPVTVTDPSVTDLTCTPSPLAPGDTMTCTASQVVSADEAMSGSVTNTATAWAQPVLNGANAGWPISIDNPADSTVTDTVTIPTQVGAMTFAKSTLGDPEPTVGEQITYRFTVTNSGTTALENITITDPRLGLQDYLCHAGSVAPGVQVTCDYTYRVTQDDVDGREIVNTAMATASPSQGTDISVYDTVTTPTAQSPGIKLLKEVATDADGLPAFTDVNGNGVVDAGDQVSYLLHVTNTGNITLTDIRLTDAKLGLTDELCDAGPLLPDLSLTCSYTNAYTLTQADIDAGLVTNTATASGVPPQVGPTPVDPIESAPAEATATIPQSTDLRLVKTGTFIDSNGNGRADAGDQVQYTFQVMNASNVTVHAITITDAALGFDNPPLTCETTELEPGGTTQCTAPITHVITQADVDSGRITNSATAAALTPADRTIESSPATVITELPAAAQLSLTKTAGNIVDTDVPANGTPDAGDTITYTFDVANTGNVTLTGVALTDVIAASSTELDVTCPRTTLEVTGPLSAMTCTATYTLTQVDIDLAEVTNNATVTATSPRGEQVTRTDAVTVPLPAEISISLEKQALAYVDVDSDGHLDTSDAVPYVFTVTNTGATTLTNIEVTDPKLSDVTCPDDDLAPGATMTCTAVPYYPTQAEIDAGQINNTATVDAAGPNGAPASDTASHTIEVEAEPGITIAKNLTAVRDLDDNGADAGDELDYAFVVTNTGNVTLTGVQVVDTVIRTVEPTATDVAVTCPATTLAAHTSMTCTATYVAQQVDINLGEVINEAQVTGTAPNGDEVSASETFVFRARIANSIALVKSVVEPSDTNGDGVVGPGDVLTYIFTVTNTGNATLSDVVVNDPRIGVTNLACGTGGLDPADAVTCEAQYELTADDVHAGGFTNTASVSGQPPATLLNPAPVPVTARSAVPVSIEPAAALTLTKTAGPVQDTDVPANGVPDAGDTITYSFVVTNTGNVTITDIHVLDPNLATVTCDTTTLLAGQSTTCVAAPYVLTQRDVNTGSVTNSAEAHGTPAAGTLEPATATVTTDLPAAPQLAVTKLATLDDTNGNGRPDVGEFINYSFTVTNTGNVTLTQVSIADPLLAATGWQCAPALAPGEEQTCAGLKPYQVTQADVDAGDIHNTATAAASPPSGPRVESSAENHVTIAAEPALALVKQATVVQTDGNTTVDVGDTITYSFTVTNTGNVTLAPVTISDAALGLVDMSCADTLAPGDEATCAAPASAHHTVTQADVDAGSIVNTATGSATAPPVGGVTPNPISSNESTSVTPIAPRPLLSIVKTGVLNDVADADGELNGLADAGETITYTFTVTNGGNVTVSNLGIVDPKLDAADPAVTITCAQTTLGPGASTTCTASAYTVTQADVDSGSVDNYAWATGTMTSGPVQSDPYDSAIPTNSRADLSLDKSVQVQSGAAAAGAGDVLEYSFAVTNTGTVTVNAITILDESLTDAGVSITCPPGPVLPAQTVTCTATRPVDQDLVDLGHSINEATAQGQAPGTSIVDGEEVDYVLVESEPDTAVMPTDFAPELTLTKTAGAVIDNPGGTTGVPDAGDTITYSLVVTNSGSVTITDIDVEDPLLGTVTCPATTLAPGADMTCVAAAYVLTQADIDAGWLHNQATASGQTPPGVDADGAATDPRPVSDTDAVDVQLAHTPGLDLVKAAELADTNSNGLADLGELITYTFTVTNSGNVTVTDLDINDPKVGTVTCAVTELAPGATATCTATYAVTQADVDSGRVLNVATAAAMTPAVTDPNGSVTPPAAVTSDEAQASVPTNTAAALSLAKTAAPATGVTAGDEITYSFAVTNTGAVTVQNISISDPMFSPADITCPAQPLAPTQTMTCTATHVVTQVDVDAGSITNTASAAGTTMPRPGDTGPISEPVTSQPASVTVTTASDASMSLSKTASPISGVTAGDDVTYTLVVTNTGSVTLSEPQLTDPMCTPVYASGDANSDGRVQPTEAWTYTCTHTVTQAQVDAGAIVNTASASALPPATSANPDPTPVTAQASVTVQPDASASLALTKTAELADQPGPDGTPNGRADVGEIITYTMTVTNTGAVTLHDVVVADPKLAAAGIDLQCTATTLTPGGDPIVCTAAYAVTQADIDAGEVANTATAQGTTPDRSDGHGGVIPGTRLDPVSASATVPAQAATSLSVTKQASAVASPAVAGTQVTFTFTVTNTGTVTVSDVQVSDPLLAGVSCPSDALAPGAALTCAGTAPYVLTQADVDAGWLHNTATATAQPAANLTAPTAAATLDVPLPMVTGLELVKATDRAPDAPLVAGEQITYTFTVTNTSNVTLQNLVINDPLLSGAGVAVTCPAAPLAPGGSAECTSAPYVVTAADAERGLLRNTATASAFTPAQTNPDGSVTPPQEVTAQDSLTLPGTVDPAFTLTKSATVAQQTPGVTGVGDRIAYQFTVTNTGNVPLTQVLVSDPALQTDPFECAATLLPGATATCAGPAEHVITQADVDAGGVANTATASAVPPADATGNPADPIAAGPATSFVAIAAAPGIELVKASEIVDTNGDGRVTPGDTIVYTFTVTNIGNVTVAPVTITDALLGMTAVECAPSLAPDAEVTCTPDQAQLVLTQAMIDSGQVVNEADAEATSPTGIDADGNPVPGQRVNHSDTLTTPIPVTAALRLDKTAEVTDVDGSDSTNAGDLIVYSFTVTNTGNATLAPVVVTDPALGLTDFECAATVAPGETVTCAAPADATHTISLADVAAGAVINTATAAGTTATGQTATSTSTQVVPIVPAPRVNLDKVATVTDANGNGITDLGDIISYSFTVTNTGDTALSEVRIDDPALGLTGWLCADELAVGAAVTCDSGVTHTITQPEVDAGSVINTATVTANPPGTVTPPPAPALQMIKTARLGDDNANGYADAGEAIDYTFLVANTGNTDLSDVGVVDDMLAGAGVSVTCPADSLATGASMVCTATYVVTDADAAASAVTNTAHATGTHQGITVQSDAATVTTPTPPAAPVSPPSAELVKTAVWSDDPANPDDELSEGDTLRYNFIVINTGASALTDLQITDPQLGGAQCVIDELAAGASTSCPASEVHILTADDIAAGEVVNTATLSGPALASVTDQHRFDTTQTPLESAEPHLVKTAVLDDANGNGRADEGESVTYRFHIVIQGQGEAFDLEVSDAMLGAGAVTCPDVDVPGGTHLVCTSAPYVLTADDVAGATVTNSADASGYGPNGVPIESNTATATLPAAPPAPEPTAALALIKTAAIDDTNGNGLADEGETIQYAFVLVNTGSVVLTGVGVDDPLAGAVTCPATELAPGAAMTCTAEPYQVTANDASRHQVINVATATATGNGMNVSATDTTTTPTGVDLPPATATDTAVVPTASAPAVRIDKTATVTDIGADGITGVGDLINYAFTVTNTGNVTLSNVMVSDEALGISELVCAATLVPGESITCEAPASHTVTRADRETGSRTNAASVTADVPCPGGECTPVSDVDSVTTMIAEAPALTLAKTATGHDANGDGVVSEGETITYTFTVTNTGNVALHDLRIQDPALDAAGVAVTCPAEELAPGASLTCTTGPYQVTAADVAAGRVDNVATVTGEVPGGTAQNSGSITSAPATATTAVAPAPSVPSDPPTDPPTDSPADPPSDPPSDQPAPGPTPPGKTPLPRTGAESMLMLALAAVLFALGSGLYVVGRSRRHQ